MVEQVNERVQFAGFAADDSRINQAGVALRAAFCRVASYYQLDPNETLSVLVGLNANYVAHNHDAVPTLGADLAAAIEHTVLQLLAAWRAESGEGVN